MGKKVAQAVVSYMDADGNWQTALRDAEIDVHKDDLGRLEAAGAFDAPAAVEPEPEPEPEEAEKPRTARKSSK